MNPMSGAHFRCEAGIVFFSIGKFEDLQNARATLEAELTHGRIRSLVFLLDQPDLAFDQVNWRLELFDWLAGFSIPTIAYIDGTCSGAKLEFALMCDLRLGGPNLSIHYRQAESEGFFDFERRFRLVVGRTNALNPSPQVEWALSGAEAARIRLINRIIVTDDVEKSISEYLQKLLSDKPLYQINSIMRCFNHYKTQPLCGDGALLLEQETLQFCYLMRKNYLKAQNENGE